jgi:cobalt-zinc-cadmium efflux system outer membrane protein
MKKLIFALALSYTAFAQMPMEHDHNAMPGMQHDHSAMQHEQTPTSDISAVQVPDLLAQVTARKAMTLEEWQAIAARQSPMLTAARAYVRSLQAEARQSGQMPNPEVGYQGEQIRGGSYHGGEQGAYAQQRFVLGNKLGLARNAGDAEARAAQVAVEEAEARLRSNVGQAFYSALRAQAEVQVRRDLLSIAHDSVLTVRGYANVGMQDAPDVLAAEVEEESAAVEVMRAQREYLGSFRSLAALAGAQAMEVRPLQGDLQSDPVADAHALAERAVLESPTVKRAVQEVAAAEARVRVASRAYIPDLTVKAGAQWNGEEVAPQKSTGVQSFASAGITLPLWNRNQFGSEASRVEVERARADLEQAKLQVASRVAVLEQQYEGAHFAALRYRDAMLPRAQQAYTMYTQKYGQMAAPYSQVLVWQRRLGELRIASLHAWEESWRTKVALENYGLGDSAGQGDINIAMPLSSSAGAMVRSSNGSMVNAMPGSALQ